MIRDNTPGPFNQDEPLPVQYRRNIAKAKEACGGFGEVALAELLELSRKLLALKTTGLIGMLKKNDEIHSGWLMQVLEGVKDCTESAAALVGVTNRGANQAMTSAMQQACRTALTVAGKEAGITVEEIEDLVMKAGMGAAPPVCHLLPDGRDAREVYRQ